MVALLADTRRRIKRFLANGLKRHVLVKRRQRLDTGKQRTCLFLVALHLDHQRVEPVELYLASQETDERNRANFAIEIASKVELIGFKQRFAVTVDRWAPPEIRHPIEDRPILTAKPHRINAMCKLH